MWTCIVFIVGALQNSASLAPSLYENCVVTPTMDDIDLNQLSASSEYPIFPGNSDRNTKVENSLSEQIQARLVRLHPKEYQDYPTMRWDVMVCKSAFSGHPRVSVLHGVLGGVVYNECDPLPATYSVNSSMISHLFDGNLLSCIRNPKRGMFFALRLFVEYQSGAPSFGVVIRGDFNCDSLVVGIGHPGNTRCNAKYRRCTPVAGGACQVTCLSDGDDVIMFGLMTRNEEFVLCDIQFVE
ncbi:hypothetical protein CAPTEDRAFT_185392 [Capitella teleta]|uniref:ZP domain-containing protein n=1 Tax=Capitella teleta TaxID=283909 RepID=R7TGY9_CAPTE|nr:hypothetical protein CAPTEDRAFT_185392 [Capitella teleta]|eukprot:ELT90821.1 hypothetical protein CAPTEDRAFT_185392 [Capitella teleta]